MEPRENQNEDQLIGNHRFIKWILHPDLQSEQFWQAYLAQHPERKEEAEKAAKIIKALNITEPMPDKEEVDLVWARIEQKLQKKPSDRGIKLYLAIAAAILVGLIAGGLLFWQFQSERAHIDYNSIAKADIFNSEVRLLHADSSETVLAENNPHIIYNNKGDIEIEGNEKLTQKRGNNESKQPSINQLIVPWGKRSSLTLADGTILWLNSGSRAIYPVVFEESYREIFIEGEAYLEVAPKSNQPFYLVTKNIRIKVLGTKFNITDYPKESTSTVVLVEGSVQATIGASKLTIKPNQLLQHENGTDQVMITQTDILPWICWKDGWMLCQKEALELLTTKLSRYFNIDISFENPELKKLTLTGKLDLKNGLESVMKTISSTAPIGYRVEQNKIVITTNQKQP